MPDHPLPPAYRLDKQVGFLLRRASQRHLAIFSAHIPDLTPTQFAALAKLSERGSLTQNELGRHTAMDAATIKGVVDRLKARGLVATRADQGDLRRIIVDISERGMALFDTLAPAGLRISDETLSPLDTQERRALVALLERLG